MSTPPHACACSLLVASFLAACHGGSGGAAPGASDTTGPELVVDYPPGRALTGASSLHVRGRATDPSGIQSVTVEGVAARLDPSTGVFDAVVPLADGDNALDVEALDLRGNLAGVPDAVLIRRETPLLGAPSAIAVDAAHGRLLVLDPLFPGVIAVDLATRRRSVLSEPDQGPPLASPTALVLAGANVWVAGGAELQRVELAGGARTAVIGTGAGVGPAPARIDALAYDAPNDRLFALDGSAPARVFAFDAATGARSLLSGDGAGAGPALLEPVDLVFDATHGRLLALDAFADAVLAIEPASGLRSEFSGPNAGAGPALIAPTAFAIAPAASRLYVADAGAEGLSAIDLATGERAFTPNVEPRRPAIDFESTSLAWDGAQGRLFTRRWNGVVAIDAALVDGAPFSADAVGVGRTFVDPSDLAFDELRDQLLIHDQKPEGSRMVRVFVRSGSRRTGSGVTATKYFSAAGAAIDRAADRLLTLGPSSDQLSQRMLAYRLGDGIRSEVATVPLAEPAIGLCLLPGRTSAALFSEVELVRFDLATHAASPLAAQPRLLGPLRGAVAASATLWVADARPGTTDEGRVVEVGLDDGAVTVLTSDLGFLPADLAFDAERARVLALDELGEALVAIDPSSGARTVLTSGGDTFVPGAGAEARRTPSFAEPRGLAFDARRRVAYTTHAGALRGIVATDVETGERVILSR